MKNYNIRFQLDAVDKDAYLAMNAPEQVVEDLIRDFDGNKPPRTVAVRNKNGRCKIINFSKVFFIDIEPIEEEGEENQ